MLLLDGCWLTNGFKRFFDGDDFTFFCARIPPRKTECPSTNECIVRNNRGLAMGIDY